MINFYNYPTVPDNLNSEIMFHVDNFTANSTIPGMNTSSNVTEQINLQEPEPRGLGVSFTTAKKLCPGLATFIMIPVPNGELKDWVKSNITDKFNGLHVQVIHGEYVLPHVDVLRKKAWNYIISDGDADTVFYQLLPQYRHMPVYSNSWVLPNMVTELHRIKLPKYRWHELNVTQLHGVENINKVRIMLSLSFV